jgi:hypothetical protein
MEWNGMNGMEWNEWNGMEWKTTKRIKIKLKQLK